MKPGGLVHDFYVANVTCHGGHFALWASVEQAYDKGTII
jgi:hypothetical protein